MRKADYSLLAQLIAAELKTYRGLSSGPARVDSLERLARNFAKGASVDALAFLKACTVEPGVPDGFSCVSVVGGWQTRDNKTGALLGPVFNACTDLWAWQRNNLPRA